MLEIFTLGYQINLGKSIKCTLFLNGNPPKRSIFSHLVLSQKGTEVVYLYTDGIMIPDNNWSYISITLFGYGLSLIKPCTHYTHTL